MKQIIYDKKGKIQIKEVPMPAIDSHEVLIRNEFSVLSAGTEKSMIELMKKPLWKMAMDRPDLTKQVMKFAKSSGIKKTLDLVKSRVDIWHLLGYSSSGVVEEVGSKVTGFSKGDLVACIGSGFANHAEFVAVPHNMVAKIPKGVDIQDAAHTGIACIALQSIRQLNPQLGEKIAVVGLGFIGQMVAQMLRTNGCEVVGVDIDSNKTKKDYIDSTSAEDVDGVIIAAAAKQDLINDAIDMCRKKGRVVLLGVCGMNIDRQKMFEKEIDFTISTAFGPGTFDVKYEQLGRDYPTEYVRWTANRNMEAVLDLMRTKKLTVERSPEYDIEEAEKAYKDVTKGKIVTALFKYSNKFCKKKVQVSNKFCKKNINVVIVGAGQFIKGFVVPILQKMKGYSIYAIVTKNGHNARKLAEEGGAKYAATDYKAFLADSNVDLAIIGTRHDSHARVSIDFLEANKHVFCEKPMAINKEEFDILTKSVRKTKKTYACGFNRRYSPTIRAIKQQLVKSYKPIIANYVFNNTKLPEDHWVNIPEIGGGRIIGEACHIMDVFNFWTGSKPVSVNTTKLTTDEHTAVITLKYEDGSVCSLTYCCVGDDKLPRESCVVFQDGKTYKMEGFDKGDEGHGQEFVELYNQIFFGYSDLISKEGCIMAMEPLFGEGR